MVGKRNIKTSIAVFLTLLISQLLKLEYPFFAVIAAIFSMENTIANTYKAGIYRMLGTLIGALVGTICVLIQPNNAILLGVGTMVVITICNALKWDRAVPIAGVVFAAIMLSLNNKNPFQYSISRVLATLLGIVVAVLVNYLMFPPNDLSELRKSIHDISKKISDTIVQVVCSAENIDLYDLRLEVIDCIRYLETYRTEFMPKALGNKEFLSISKELDALRGILAHLKTLDELGPNCCLIQENIERLKDMNICSPKAVKYEDNHDNIIYNYHVGKILDMLALLYPKEVKV